MGELKSYNNLTNSSKKYQFILLLVLFLGTRHAVTLLDPGVYINVTGPSTAGNTTTLTCTITVDETLIPEDRPFINIDWIAPNGTEIGNETLMDVTVSMLHPASVTLTFNPLHTSHGGEYWCMASGHKSGSYNITVQIPTPTLILTVSPVNDDFYTGLQVTFTGRAEFNPAVDTPLTVDGVWNKTNSLSLLTTDARVTFNGPAQVEGTPNMVYETSLTISSLNLTRGDSGDYDLTLFINSLQRWAFILGTTATVTRNIMILNFVPQKVSVSSLSEGVPTAGNVYTLRCIVNRVGNFNSLTMLEGVWLNAKNDIITSNTDYIITGDASTTSTSLTIDLTFTKLKTSHGGTYSCSANMTIPDVVTDHQVNITTSVIVGIPPPVVNVELLDDLAISGTVVHLMGTSLVDSVVDTDLIVSGSWSRLGSSDLSNLSTLSDTNQVSPYGTTLTFNPLRIASKDEGHYVYTVSISSQDSNFISSVSTTAIYSLSIQPYPELVIIDSIISGVCMSSETIILMGSVTLLPHTAVYTLSYSWVEPANLIATSDLLLSDGNLTVINFRDKTGIYTLTICLDVPGSCMTEHCSIASYLLTTDEPGSISSLVCSPSDDGDTLSLNWNPPFTLPESVHDYLVEIRRYIQLENTTMVSLILLGSQLLTKDTLRTDITQEVVREIPYHVSVMTQNVAGCGVKKEIDCFSREGVPSISPQSIQVSRSESNHTVIQVRWQLLTLLEAKGFISYVIELKSTTSLKRQQPVSKTVSGNQNKAAFLNTDPTQSYEVSVCTIVLSSRAMGPCSPIFSLPSLNVSTPSVIIISSPITSHYFTGLQLNLICHIELPRLLDIVSVQWKKSGSSIISNSRINVDEVPVEINPQLYQSVLSFSYLDQKRGDNGSYTCIFTVSSEDLSDIEDTVTVTINVQIETSLFQLRIIGLESDCTSWRAKDSFIKERDIILAIIENIILHCECDFTEDNIIKGVFRCFSSSSRAVTYRAELQGTLQASVPELLQLIREWVSGTVSIPIDLQLLSLDSTCPVVIDSSIDGECTIGENEGTSSDGSEGTSSDGSEASRSDGSEASRSSNAEIEIAAGTASVIVILLIILILAVIIALVYKHCHSSVDKESLKEVTTVSHLQNHMPPPQVINTIENDDDYANIEEYTTMNNILSSLGPLPPIPSSHLPSHLPIQPHSSIPAEEFNIDSCSAYNIFASAIPIQTSSLSDPANIDYCSAYITTQGQSLNDEEDYT